LFGGENKPRRGWKEGGRRGGSVFSDVKPGNFITESYTTPKPIERFDMHLTVPLASEAVCKLLSKMLMRQQR
jgi:hypothetical protein